MAQLTYLDTRGLPKRRWLSSSEVANTVLCSRRRGGIRRPLDQTGDRAGEFTVSNCQLATTDIVTIPATKSPSATTKGSDPLG